ncbi:hypothetical protein NZ35_28875 [Pseudomonas chlororaphis]|uniref:Uncharacterized protein n=1 Tax=Pseudomonas chlororaphis TaxID=587753 RepID=A0A0A6D5D6_9PSED|nr:hypothetical protein NZ35_28875 [Pseudomonas chlororaphis]
MEDQAVNPAVDQAPPYRLALLGSVPDEFAAALREQISTRLADLGLTLGRDVSPFDGRLSDFRPSIDRCCAALCFEIDAAHEASVEQPIKRRIPLIPYL